MLAVQSLGIHQPAYFPSFGEGFEDAFRNVDIAAADVFQKLGLSIGDKFVYENTILQVVRARATVAKGDWVKLFIGGATRLGTVAAAPAPTKARFASSFALTAGELENVEKAIPSWAFITSGTGIGQRRRILGNSGSTDTLVNQIITSLPKHDIPAYVDPTAGPDAFATAPVNADGLSIVCPWEVTPTAAALDLAQGVALGPITSGNYGVICVAGLALAKCVGSTDPLVAYKALVASATAGVASGQPAVPGTATIAMNQASSIIGWAVDAYTGASALRHVWVSGTYAM